MAPENPQPTPARKIVHVDMDAFYASVEQRDDPRLRGRPVVVAWRGPRSVVCAASYEARAYGVRSAMPALRAERICPQATFIAPDFSRYRAVSRQVRAILLRYTALVEPLSLDEAYLDVTTNNAGLASATAVAQAIRADIVAATGLTASAGVAPNKFLAKIASDWRKPDGLFVIPPHGLQRFLDPLPVARLPGVGRATESALARIGIATVADMRVYPEPELRERFGRFGTRLYQLARGIDSSPVCPDRPVQSISSERTFETDLPLTALAPALVETAAQVWNAARRSDRIGRTVVVKLKTREFRLLTRSHTPPLPPQSAQDLTRHALSLLEKLDLPPTTRYRLAGVGLANFTDTRSEPLQARLFDEDPAGSQTPALEHPGEM
jgi:DNA polymerase-4